MTNVLNKNIDKLIVGNISYRSVYATIINRAYYSAYSFALLWLKKMHFFSFKSIDYFRANNLNYVTEHKQVRNGLKEYNLDICSNLLFQLHNLRKKQIIILMKI
ncbi:MAG: hypothetical protein Q4P14_06280 [Methanobacteriaceae archaeon]|nr:hypothetical protein [Methanobacteriaceae archaeon]